MTYYLIGPGTAKIPVVDTYVCQDHMPDARFEINSEFTQDQLRNYWISKNTITDLILASGTQADRHFFIFDHYLYLEDYNSNSCFFPNFFMYVIGTYLDSVTKQIDFGLKNRAVSCLMNKLRYNRIIASCYFANQNELENLTYTQGWSSDQHSENLLFELLQLGYLNDWQNQGVPAVELPKFFIPTASETTLSLSETFQTILFDLIHPTAINIVLEPIFWESGCIVTEKYLNAIYSGTIPVVDGYHIYDCLEYMGFDTFKDIINTSSQYEKNPVKRVWKMLSDNQSVFNSGLELINRSDIQERILNNVAHARNPELCLTNFLKNGNRPELVEKCFEILRKNPRILDPRGLAYCPTTLEVYFNCNK